MLPRDFHKVPMTACSLVSPLSLEYELPGDRLALPGFCHQSQPPEQVTCPPVPMAHRQASSLQTCLCPSVTLSRLPALCWPGHPCSSHLSPLDSNDVREPGCLGPLSVYRVPSPHNDHHLRGQRCGVCVGAQHSQRPPKKPAPQAGMEPQVGTAPGAGAGPERGLPSAKRPASLSSREHVRHWGQHTAAIRGPRFQGHGGFDKPTGRGPRWETPLAPQSQ